MSLKFSIFEGNVEIRMHLRILYLHANGQDEEECEDVQNGMQFSITYVYL